MKLPIKIHKKATTFNIEMDVDRFERVAAALGMFGSDFLHSLDQAEKDIKAGRVHKHTSLREIM